MKFDFTCGRSYALCEWLYLHDTLLEGGTIDVRVAKCIAEVGHRYMLLVAKLVFII